MKKLLSLLMITLVLCSNLSFAQENLYGLSPEAIEFLKAHNVDLTLFDEIENQNLDEATQIANSYNESILSLKMQAEANKFTDEQIQAYVKGLISTPTKVVKPEIPFEPPVIVPPMPEMKSKKVTVTIPDFKITVNNISPNQHYAEFPMYVYKGVTYMPIVTHYAGLTGLETTWYENVLYIKSYNPIRHAFRMGELTTKNKKYEQAYTLANPVVINKTVINNSKEPYPLLKINDIVYFPLTWRFVVDELGWKYNYDNNSGLTITTTHLGKSDQYISKDDVFVGFPPSNINDNYIFTYQKGEGEEVEFDLSKYFPSGYFYYYNSEVETNGYIHRSEKAYIEDNLLYLPVVREGGKAENFIYIIDFVKQEVVDIKS